MVMNHHNDIHNHHNDIHNHHNDIHNHHNDDHHNDDLIMIRSSVTHQSVTHLIFETFF